MPTFGQDTIRRFHKNVSELKRLAARDFEDLLQVSLGLLSVSLNMIDVLHSVLFRSLQGCCLILIMHRCYACCLYSVIGMVLQSYAFTQMKPLPFLRG